MIKVELSTEGGEKFALEISEQDHVLWQIVPGEQGKDEQGYLAWNELESDLAEGIKGVELKLVEAVQLWRDNYMIAV